VVEKKDWLTFAGPRKVLKGMLMGVAVPRLLMGKLQLACLLLPILFATPGWTQSDPVNEWRSVVAAQTRLRVYYPPNPSGQGGEARIAFTLDRSGKVTSATLVRSTGVSRLDQAALAAIEKAQFSPAPPEVDDSRLNFVAPIVFAPRMNNSGEQLRSDDEQLKARLRGICRGC
jgi:TonB family protein